MLNLIINILKTSLRLAKKKIFIVFILIFLSMFLEFLGISLIMPAITLFTNPDKYTEYSNHFLLSKFDNININTVVLIVTCWSFVLNITFMYNRKLRKGRKSECLL